MVEAMTLRKTTVRDGDGTLCHSQFPNHNGRQPECGFQCCHGQRECRFLSKPRPGCRTAARYRHGDPHQQPVQRRLCIPTHRFSASIRSKDRRWFFPWSSRRRQPNSTSRCANSGARVRLALEEHHLLPGDANRVFHFSGDESAVHATMKAENAAGVHDPTTHKAPDGSLFGSE